MLTHNFWTVQEDPQARAAKQVNFLKYLVLVYGAADWPLTLG